MFNCIFCGGIAEPLSACMPLWHADWSLVDYTDLQLNGSAFTVGVVEVDYNIK